MQLNRREVLVHYALTYLCGITPQATACAQKAAEASLGVVN